MPRQSRQTTSLVLKKDSLLVCELGDLLDIGGGLFLLSLASSPHLQSIDTDQEVQDAVAHMLAQEEPIHKMINSPSNQCTNTSIAHTHLNLAFLSTKQQRQHPSSHKAHSEEHIGHRDEQARHLLAHLLEFLSAGLFLLFGHVTAAPAAAGGTHGLAEDRLADTAHAHRGEDVVEGAEDEEEGEKVEEGVRGWSEHAAGAVVVVNTVRWSMVWWRGRTAGVHAVVRRTINSARQGTFVGEQETVVLDGFGDKEGDDVVEGQGGSEELNDEGGRTSWATCSIGHEGWHFRG